MGRVRAGARPRIVARSVTGSAPPLPSPRSTGRSNAAMPAVSAVPSALACRMAGRCTRRGMRCGRRSHDSRRTSWVRLQSNEVAHARRPGRGMRPHKSPVATVVGCLRANHAFRVESHLDVAVSVDTTDDLRARRRMTCGAASFSSGRRRLEVRGVSASARMHLPGRSMDHAEGRRDSALPWHVLHASTPLSALWHVVQAVAPGAGIVTLAGLRRSAIMTATARVGVVCRRAWAPTAGRKELAVPRVRSADRRFRARERFLETPERPPTPKPRSVDSRLRRRAHGEWVNRAQHDGASDRWRVRWLLRPTRRTQSASRKDVARQPPSAGRPDDTKHIALQDRPHLAVRKTGGAVSTVVPARKTERQYVRDHDRRRGETPRHRKTCTPDSLHRDHHTPSPSPTSAQVYGRTSVVGGRPLIAT